MKLVLAEKPSVAQSIAKVLGAAKREDGYLEGNGYVVSWCVGHLVELAQPEVYDAKYSKWAYADLPIFPMDWQYEVSAGTKKQFGILKKLMAREDVASLVCATDAGREGELIFRLVYHKAGCRKPFERLWISSMEDVAIKEGFENLRSGTEYDALYANIISTIRKCNCVTISSGCFNQSDCFIRSRNPKYFCSTFRNLQGAINGQLLTGFSLYGSSSEQILCT